MATSTFFLCKPTYTAVDSEGRRAVLLPLRDVSRFYKSDLCARWRGPDALAWLDQHQNELRPGRPLSVEFSAVWVRDGELRAEVSSCCLAPLPPSWLKHIEKVSHNDHQESTHP